MKKKILSLVLAVLLIIPCLFSLSACNWGGDNFNLLNEDFCFTIKGKTVTKDNFMKKTGGEGRWSTYYFSIDLNYKDLTQYDWLDTDKVTDLDNEGCIKIDSFTYSGDYKFYASINHIATGSELVEIKPGQVNKVDTTMGDDEYKRVMNIYVYDGEKGENESNYLCTILIIFADSTEISD